MLATVDLTLKTPTGLAWDGSNLWVADLSTATLNDGGPGHGQRHQDPRRAGLRDPWAWRGTGHGSGCSTRATNRFLGDKTAYAVNPATGVTERALPLDLDTPEGLAWDGKALWVADAQAGIISRLDNEDGTTWRSFPSPVAGRKTQEIGLVFAGRWLLVSDRVTDTIYRMDPASGAVLDSFPAPGPYATGLAWDGKSLWCADYEARKLYKVCASTDAAFVTSAARRETVTYREAWRNFGPGVVETLEVFIAVPQDLPNQKLLKPPAFDPAPTEFVTDQWGQRCARFLFKGLKAGQEVSAVMTVEAEVRKVRWYVDPERVGKLSDIPADIAKTYTGDSTKLDMAHPVIQSAVKEALAGETNPYWMARKINKYIQDKMRYERVGGWNVAPVVLARGTGSCSEYTFVMLAMCHAAGLPARYAGSVVIRGDEASRDDVFHRWVEVYLPNYGWVPVDPSGGDSPAPAEQAAFFGGLDNRFLITTLGAGDSTTLGWDYNSNVRWTARGRVKLFEQKLGDWAPAGKHFEPKIPGEAGGVTCEPKR